MLWKRNVDSRQANRSAARPPVDVQHFNNQSFPLENLAIG